MSRKEYTTISAWTRTIRELDKFRRRLAKDRGLPTGKQVSMAEAIHIALIIANSEGSCRS